MARLHVEFHFTFDRYLSFQARLRSVPLSVSRGDIRSSNRTGNKSCVRFLGILMGRGKKIRYRARVARNNENKIPRNY